MEFDFPYDRTGPPDQLGRTKARFLTTQSGEYLKAEVEENVWAYKKGEFLEVENESVVAALLRDFFAVGADPFPVMYSRTARGSFTQVTNNAPPNAFYSQEFGLTGNGLGFRLTFEDLGLVRDIAGNYAHVFKWPYYWTDGFSYELRTEPLVFGVGLGTGGVTYDGNLEATPGAVVAGTAWHALAFDSRDAADQRQHRVVFMRDSGAERYGAIVYEVPNKIVRLLGMQRVGPQSYLVLTMGFIAAAIDPVYGLDWEPADTPLFEFHLSTDNGVSWTNLGLPPSMAAHMVDWRAYYDSLGASYSQVLRNTWFRAAPMPDGRTLVSLLYLYFVNYGTVDQTLMIRVAKFFVDPSGAFLDLEHVDFDSLDPTDPHYVQKGFAYFERGLLATSRGVLIMRPTDAENYKTTPFKLGLSTDGLEPASFTPMPFPACYTGRPTMLDPSTLVCPMFDGRYCLYQSRDGMTWTRRALIHASTTPPSSEDRFSEMNSFTVLSYLKQDERAVNATPGTPWFSDDRINRP